MSTTKKIFAASTVIFVSVLLFWGVYILSFKEKGALLPDEKKKGTGASLSLNIFQDSSIFPITKDETIAPTLAESGNYIKYYSPAGQAFRIDLEGKNQQIISPRTHPSFLDAFWSPGKNKVILKTAQTNNRFSFSVFDLKDNTETALKDNIDSIYWQNDSKIFYKYFDEKNKKRSLNISDPDGSNWKELTEVPFRDARLSPIPKTGFVSFWNKPNGAEETNLFSVSAVSGEKKLIFKGKFGADYSWNKSGTRALVSYTNLQNDHRINLATINDSGGDFKDLGVPTFASKCVWSEDNKTVYYALPGDIPENVVLPNDYYGKKFEVYDTFWKIDTTTGNKKRLVDEDKIKEKYDATNLFLNEDESVLFFLNRYDQKLYKISL